MLEYLEKLQAAHHESAAGQFLAGVVSHGPDSRPGRRSSVGGLLVREDSASAGSPTDLYGAVVFLASDASHYVTGVRHSWLMEAYLLALSGLFQRSRAYSAIVYFAMVGAIESKRRMQ